MTVHFIGAGPGAADLLTLRAARLLATSPVCVYAGTYVTADVLEHCPPGAELVDSQHLNLDDITAVLVRADRAGQDVARLCSGDPSIYSAVAEQTRRLDGAGVPWDVTPGVPAYAAAAALLGRELTVPEVAQTVILTRAQARSTRMPEGEQLSRLAASGATLVLHLAITRMRAVAEELAPVYGADCPVAVVHRATAPDEQVLRGTLADIANQVERLGLRQAAVILVGRVLTAQGFVDSHLYASRRSPAG
ncbi:precorrin-4 C(11)-methyltransferase [Nakamurella endophytica]|uniref:Precorrin-4 C(11)-methyltransferase n=1 Tax=Nakamurella endophytica TaxID=1748367 RepID=A0A917SLH5_9ACTN|nr:precorrin-4 C(11)-methyltransferase [Nakamurella endophytica]GGL85241.1 precorrin-4 C(11)-methyltransferase [Nakamurella endophytica]